MSSKKIQRVDSFVAALALAGALAAGNDTENAVEDAIEATYMLQNALQGIDGAGALKRRAVKRAKKKVSEE